VARIEFDVKIKMAANITLKISTFLCYIVYCTAK